MAAVNAQKPFLDNAAKSSFIKKNCFRMGWHPQREHGAGHQESGRVHGRGQGMTLILDTLALNTMPTYGLNWIV